MSDSVITALKNEHVIPDVIPSTTKFNPSVFFSIIWPGEGAETMLGNKLPRDDTLKEPEIKVSHIEGGQGSGGGPLYTLVMTDPDAPSRTDPKFGEFRHWLLSGIKLSAGRSATKPHSALTSYYPPAPPPGSGFHRYVFLLFQEPTGGVDIPADAVEREDDPEHRRSWKAMKFADKYGLKLVGANFFLTERKA